MRTEELLRQSEPKQLALQCQSGCREEGKLCFCGENYFCPRCCGARTCEHCNGLEVVSLCIGRECEMKCRAYFDRNEICSYCQETVICTHSGLAQARNGTYRYRSCLDANGKWICYKCRERTLRSMPQTGAKVACCPLHEPQLK
jgi:hypothetical protein